MKRVYVVLELAEDARFDPSDEAHQDELAEDMLLIADGVTSVTVYTCATDIVADEAEAAAAD